MEPESSEESGPPGAIFSDVVNILLNMFGQVMDNDVILAVVESCDGDLQHSIDALMQISKDAEETVHQSEKDELPELNSSLPIIVTSSNNDQMASNKNQLPPSGTEHLPPTPPPPPPPQSVAEPTLNYANASRRTGVVPKKRTLPMNMPSGQPYKESDKKWMDQLTRIIEWHYKGYRTLVIMRGPPGSGKSYLSRKIIEATIGCRDSDFRKHIQSTDDFFIVKGKYLYAKERLSDAHTWNQNRVVNSLRNGLSPVIIDNTNVAIWELQPYITFGVNEGYYIEIIEPISPWANNAYQLFKRNSHKVPIYKIKQMLDNYQANVTAEFLISAQRLKYPSDKLLPVMRQMPPFVQEKCPSISYTTLNGKYNFNNTIPVDKTVTSSHQVKVEITSGTAKMTICKDLQTEVATVPTETKASSLPQIREQIVGPMETQPVDETESKAIPNTSEFKNSSSIEQLAQVLQKYNEVEKKLKEFDELDAQWEIGDDWDEPGPSNVSNKVELNPTAVEFQPISEKHQVQPSTNLSSPLKHLSLNLKNNPGPSTEQSSNRDKEKMLPDTTDWVDWRDITRFMPEWTPNLPSTSRQTPEKLSVEKLSSGTCMEIGDTDIFNSKYKVLTGSPKDINFYYLPREEKIPEKRMWDKSSMTNEQQLVDNYRCKNEEKHFQAFRKMFKTIAKADLREIFDKCCGDVNWAVEIVIDGVASNEFETVEEVDASDTEDLDQEQCECMSAYNIIPNVTIENKKENIPVTEQIEPSLMQRKIKKEKSVTESMQQLKKQIEQNVVIADNHYSQHCLKIRKMRRGKNEKGEASNDPLNYQYGSSPSNDPQSSIVPDYHNSDDESESSQEHEEPSVNVNLGREFIIKLDELCNRQGMTYPSNIVPIISMPVSTLNELNALWIESLTHQIESQATYSEILIKEDAEFARQLAEKEAELAQEGREPEIPDFKEIMDMDFACSLYQKDLAEWRNNESNDLAAKMSREKLYNLFPEVLPDTLSELLMAHGNNFQVTVEVLLMSTGQSEILKEKNGVNKFVMQREMARQEKILEEENKALSEEQFPVLSKMETADMKTVEQYRQEALRHLELRNLHHQKAQKYIQRGMTQCASYASEVAAFHKKKFEQANSRAATSLIQVNTANRGDNHLDLHYLFVTESLTAVDIFLDHHIKRLRDDPSRGRSRTLFIITGRGLHSSGAARVKPAVKKHLKARGLRIGEKNPGLVTTDVRAESLLTHEFES